MFANGAKGQPLWAELVEKAFAQLNAEPDAVHGGNGGALNAYEGISGGEPDVAVAEITDKDSIEYTADRLVSDAARIGAAFDSAMKLSSPPVITPGPTTSISGATMLMKSSAMMRAMTNSQFTIPGVRHNRSR